MVAADQAGNLGGTSTTRSRPLEWCIDGHSSGTRAYLCGPLPFLRAVRTQLLDSGVRAADIHYEVFGPDLWLQRAS